ncbi:hypothetical protein L3X38_029019 [Prunus dulcis]|uniref:Uncharacterized protein n=1 Tax=Prunus dulcis TaxID=3755 RepID=A0AAD4VSU4_PRUDU|nr:hypothetical protein L3X38_029019 [Prunus dulcis]
MYLWSNKKALIPKRRQACWFSLMEDYMHGLQVEEGHWHTRFPIAAGPGAIGCPQRRHIWQGLCKNSVGDRSPNNFCHEAAKRRRNQV